MLVMFPMRSHSFGEGDPFSDHKWTFISWVWRRQHEVLLNNCSSITLTSWTKHSLRWCKMRKRYAYYKYVRNVITLGQIHFLNLKKEKWKNWQKCENRNCNKSFRKRPKYLSSVSQESALSRIILGANANVSERHVKEQINLHKQTQLR